MIKKSDFYEDFRKVCEANGAIDHFNALFEKYTDNDTRKCGFNAGYEAGFNRGIISAIEMADVDKEKAGKILSELFIQAGGKGE